MYIKLFVGSLPWSIGDSELEELFQQHGTVQSARVITDRETGRSRGFGFVEMDTNDPAALISATDGQEVGGRTIRVNEAEERRNQGGGGGGGRRGGGNRDFGGAARRDSRGSRNRY
jgi:RNA recognition motif-containing protein